MKMNAQYCEFTDHPDLCSTVDDRECDDSNRQPKYDSKRQRFVSTVLCARSRRRTIIGRSAWRSAILVLHSRCCRLICRPCLRGCRIMRRRSRLQCQILVDIAGRSFRMAFGCSRHHLCWRALTLLAATCETDECQHDCNDQQQPNAAADNATDQCSVI